MVWFRPRGKDYTLYYAHLDEQTVGAGQDVVLGDTLGLMGNTGNAKTTPPHLHFGIYTNNGAVDPLPFIDPLIPPTPNIIADATKLNATMRTINRQVEFSENQQLPSAEMLKQHTVVRVLAASGNYYKIELPNGKYGYVSSKSVAEAKPLSTRKIVANSQSLLDYPNETAGIKADLAIGLTVNVIGTFQDYQLISTSENLVGWIKIL